MRTLARTECLKITKTPSHCSGSSLAKLYRELLRSALISEFVVHAHQDILDIRFGAQDPTGGLTGQPEKLALRVPKPMKLYSVNTDQCGTNIHSKPKPAVQPVRLLPEIEPTSAPKPLKAISFVLRPRCAALPIEQHSRRHEVADATRQRIEPAYLGVDCAAAGGKRRVKKCSAAVKARPVEQIANADQPCTHLVIAADLTATGKATPGAIDFRAGGNIGHVETRKGTADVAADVASGPNILRWLGGGVGRAVFLGRSAADA